MYESTQDGGDAMVHRRGSRPPDDEVPNYELWPPRGISGIVGRGDWVGLPVVAVRWRHDAPEFILYLPGEELRGADGILISETDVTDRIGPQGAGIIHDVSREIEVKWSTDESDFDRAINWYRARFGSLGSQASRN